MKVGSVLGITRKCYPADSEVFFFLFLYFLNIYHTCPKLDKDDGCQFFKQVSQTEDSANLSGSIV